MRARTASWNWWTMGGVAGLLVLSSSPVRASDTDDVKNWHLGQPAPVGHHVARKHTLGLVGGSIFGGGYAISATYGLVFLGECYFPGADGRRSEPCHPSPESRAAPFLFIPIAGPFLTFTNRDVRNDGGAVFWFSFFGAAQVAGATLLACDLAVPHYGLKRGDGLPTAPSSGQPRFLLAPAYLGRGPGLALLGQF